MNDFYVVTIFQASTSKRLLKERVKKIAYFVPFLILKKGAAISQDGQQFFDEENCSQLKDAWRVGH